MKWATVSIPVTTDANRQLDDLSVPYGKGLFVGRSVTEHGLGGWQPATSAALLAAWDIAPSRTFFDVGANIGIYAMLHARLRPQSTTVAFEPAPNVLASGETMTTANGVTVRWEHAAVSDSEGDVTLFLSARTDASNSLVSQHRKAKGTVTVPAVTLDGYVRSSGLVPSVVKIDVERHEPAVIQGAAATLDTHKPIVVAELLPGRAEGDDVRALLASHGYSAQPIESPDTPEHENKSRDWLFWPGEVPTEFDARFREWYTAVQRCMPTPPETT